MLSDRWGRGFLLVTIPHRVVACRGRNRAFAVSTDHSMMGSWSWVIHPQAQLILGCAVVNQGYPRMTLLSPRSDRKYRRVHVLIPVLVPRSV